jgi:hypothetical protein
LLLGPTEYGGQPISTPLANLVPTSTTINGVALTGDITPPIKSQYSSISAWKTFIPLPTSLYILTVKCGPMSINSGTNVTVILHENTVPISQGIVVSGVYEDSKICSCFLAHNGYCSWIVGTLKADGVSYLNDNTCGIISALAIPMNLEMLN